MWTLTSKKSGAIYYLLAEKEKHSVGRSNADLILTDASVSRLHACLYPSKDHVKAIDVGSKYGCFYNENIDNRVPMDKNVPIELKNGERIQFGALGNEWILSKLNICSITSTLSTAADKAELANIFKSLDARIADSWNQSCTHLTMSQITVTHKVLQALVENIPIVSIDFWRKYLANLRAGKPPPKAADFLPECAENLLNHEEVSFGLVPGRKTIFAGKTFLFMSSQSFEKYKQIVISAGGICENMYKGVQKTMLIRKDVIVIRYSSSTQTQSSQTVDNIFDYVKSKGRRLIPDAEIGLAIIHCSTSKYCNPDYNVVSEFDAETNDFQTSSEIIAKETPGVNFGNIAENLVSVEVPESAVYEPMSEKESINTESTDSIHVIEDTEPFAAPIAPPPIRSLTGNVTSAGGKRKRPDSNDSLPCSKKSNVEIEQLNNFEDDSMSDRLESNLIVESSEPITEYPSPSKQIETVRAKKSCPANLSGFMNKSHLTRSQASENCIENVPDNTTTRKRARLANICSDDDDNDEDLFAFDSAAAKKTKKGSDPKTKENLFDFGVTVSQKRRERQKDNSSELIALMANSQRDAAKKFAEKRNEFKLPAVKPYRYSAEGWLSKSMINMKVKTEDSKDEIEKKFNPEFSSWFDSIKSGFEVRVRPMLIVPVTRDVSCDASQAAPSNGKNFKAFVKKHNYKPQTTILATVTVGLKSNSAV